MKIRFKFQKGEVGKYLGHLDLLKLFQRAVKRAGLPVQYSEGFNPHQIMAFAHPLTLGFTSRGEYVDIGFKEKLRCVDVIKKLNAVLPDDIQILSAAPLPEGSKKLMAALGAACYTVTPPFQVTQQDVEDFMKQESILAVKKTKNSTKEVDIKSQIHQMQVNVNGQIELFVDCGSAKNIKPELVMSAFCGWKQTAFEPFQFQWERTELYYLQDEKWISFEEGFDNEEDNH